MLILGLRRSRRVLARRRGLMLRYRLRRCRRLRRVLQRHVAVLYRIDQFRRTLGHSDSLPRLMLCSLRGCGKGFAFEKWEQRGYGMNSVISNFFFYWYFPFWVVADWIGAPDAGRDGSQSVTRGTHVRSRRPGQKLAEQSSL